MSKRALILVEGQTEEKFVKNILAPFFLGRALYLEPTILVTKKVKDGPNFKGGLANFAKFESDVRRLLAGAGGALVTTMVDYYQLPSDFPGMDTRPRGTPMQRVEHVEKAIHKHFKDIPNFIPFLALHEFEAWLFSSSAELPDVMNQPNKQREFAAFKAQFQSPEEINERPNLAPSKRILSIFPGYGKTLHGPLAAQRIGLESIRTNCAHFAWWMGALEKYAGA